MHHLVKLVVPSSLHRGHRLGSSTPVNTAGEFTLFVLATLADAPSSQVSCTQRTQTRIIVKLVVPSSLHRGHRLGSSTQVNTVGEFTLFVLATLADAPSSQVSCTQQSTQRTQTRIINTSKHSR